MGDKGSSNISLSITLDTGRNWLSLVTPVHVYSTLAVSAHMLSLKERCSYTVSGKDLEELEYLSDLTKC